MRKKIDTIEYMLVVWVGLVALIIIGYVLGNILPWQSPAADWLINFNKQVMDLLEVMFKCG